jgi:hypothetical protein
MVPLGDRVKVQSLEVIDGRIVADLVEHGPGERTGYKAQAANRTPPRPSYLGSRDKDVYRVWHRANGLGDQ